LIAAFGALRLRQQGIDALRKHSYSASEIRQPGGLPDRCSFSEGPRLVFRASDVTNELVPDILTINEYFLKPVYGDKEYQISIYSSSAQNTSGWSDTVSLLQELENLNEEV
jgi:hypothetical protein